MDSGDFDCAAPERRTSESLKLVGRALELDLWEAPALNGRTRLFFWGSCFLIGSFFFPKFKRNWNFSTLPTSRALRRFPHVLPVYLYVMKAKIKPTSETLLPITMRRDRRLSSENIGSAAALVWLAVPCSPDERIDSIAA